MVLVATLYIQTIMSLLIFAPLVLAPSIIASVGGSSSLVGIYPPLAFGFGILGSMSAGLLVSRIGPWRVSVGCLVGGAAGAAIFGLGSHAALAVGAMLIGLSYGPVTAAGSTLLLRAPSANLGLKMSVRQSGVPLGSSAGGVLAPLLNNAIGWAEAFFVFGALAGISALALCLSSRAVRQERAPAAAVRPKLIRPLELAYRDRKFRALVSIAMVFSSLQNCFVSFLSVYLVDHIGLTITAAGLALGVSHVLGIGARLAWGVAADRFYATLIIAILGGLMAVSSVAAGLLQPGMSVGVVIAAVAALGSSATGWNGVVLAQASRSVPAEVTTQAVAEMVVFTYLGFILGPPVFAGISSAFGMPLAFVATGAICALATTAFAFTARAPKT